MCEQADTDSYLTIAGPAQAKFTEKMSRFLAFAWPVSSAGQAKELVQGLQNQYHDARHVCWAWVIGADTPVEYSNDNGEPSGTAGRPILGQIKSRQLRNTLVAVVRYFGGIKLGTPGLIAAYRQAASDCLDQGDIVKRQAMERHTFTFGYSDMNTVMTLLKQCGAEILERDFDNTCTITVQAPRTVLNHIKQRIPG